MKYFKQVLIAVILALLGLGIALFFYYYQPRKTESTIEFQGCESTDSQYCEI